MKSLKYNLKYISLVALLALTLGGCGDDDTSTPSAGADPTRPVLLGKLFVSVEDQGVLKSIHLFNEEEAHSSAIKVASPTAVAKTIHLHENTGAKPGEMVFSGGNVYVRVNNTNTVQMFDIASDGGEHNHPIHVGTGPMHLYKDKDEKVWIMNDGDPDEKNQADSVSVIVGGMHAEAARISVGSGQHKAAFSYPSKRVFVSNIHDDTLSVIDNDPISGTYLKTILNDPILPHNAAISSGLNPRGIDYASHNGKIYNLNIGEDVNVISVIDPVTLAQTYITKGKGDDQVPVVGSLHTRHAHGDPGDGRFIYVLSNTTDDKGNTDSADDTTTGWVVVIDTMHSDHNNGIIAKTEISHMIPARMIFGSHAKRLYITSGVGTGTPDLEIDQVVVMDIDPASPSFNQILKKVKVGNAGGQGSIGAISGDGHFLFVGNTGDTTVSVIEIETFAVVGAIDVGGAPSGIGVAAVDAHAEGGADGDAGGHDNHG